MRELDYDFVVKGILEAYEQDLSGRSWGAERKDVRVYAARQALKELKNSWSQASQPWIQEKSVKLLGIIDEFDDECLELRNKKREKSFKLGASINLLNSKSCVEELNSVEVEKSLNKYLSMHDIQNRFLNEVFLEFLILRDINFFNAEIVKNKIGVLYYVIVNFTTAAWLNIFWKPISKIAQFAINWILPAVFVVWLYGIYPTASLIVGGIYYAANLFLLLNFSFFHIKRMFTGQKSASNIIFELAFKVEAVRYEINNKPIHVSTLRKQVDNARQAGMRWNSFVEIIFDRM